MRGVLSIGILCVITGCSSAGQYGHSRTYTPLDAETEALQSATEYDPVMATRNPEKWKGKNLSLFGVVERRDSGDAGSAYVRLSVRTLEPRNLCEFEDEDSCRVTVSDREHAVVHAQIKLSADDDLGRYSVGVGSLVRVVGRLTDDYDTEDGTPVLRTSYYRHWPRGDYVTSAARDNMRR